MQEEQKNKSTGKSGHQNKNSVYDFLYHDAPRIASFLSQFTSAGYLTARTFSDSSMRGSDYDAKAQVSAKAQADAEIPLILKGNVDANGELSASKTSKVQNESSSSRTYDPFWQNSLDFLNFLDHHQLINSDIEKSSIGQFVLLSGELIMFDMSFIQNLLKQPKIKNNTLVDLRKKGDKGAAEIGIELFNNLPPSIQSYLIGDQFKTWSTLRKEGLSLSTDDLHLKHGPCISGDWSILGILDAHPEHTPKVDISEYPRILRTFDQFFSDTRAQFGREKDYYGITPLMIFREVS